ncbi:MAG: aromatic amino acid ammonia-lyase [Bacteroidia bacterium]|nr:aromatic amino acid ammonia-lyase [Bacteroidia bacterium]
MKQEHILSLNPLTVSDLRNLSKPTNIILTSEIRNRVKQSFDYLNCYIQESESPIYGINTGFGALCNVKISDEELNDLQRNLILSHACGVGEEVPVEIVRWMLYLKIRSLCYGYSAISCETLDRLVLMFNEDVYPVVYQQGSLGASGDLAPLAHLSLPLIGEGEVYVSGRKMPSSKWLQKTGLQPLRLYPKEGLALLNGTQFMSAYSVQAILQSQQLSEMADMIASLSLDAFDGRIEPFYPSLHRIRPHFGQLQTAEAVRYWLDGSDIILQPKQQVQDPYSFRCIPQVHGATKDTLAYCQSVFLTEINSVTDNPTVIPEEDLILSGGNFHGQPLALTLDFLKLAISELSSISERRTFQLLSGQRNLPAFLSPNPGIHSGMLIAQ